MHWIDWTVIAIFLISMILVGVYFSKRAGENVDSFFVSGRSLKWYVAGASMIATSFAADTPLWVGALVRQYGIHAAWQYWAPLIGSALGVVLFARMWRRSRVVTDNEILELRYSGKSAMALRGIASGVGALILCPLIIGWVAKAMVTISQQALGLGSDPVLIMGMELSPDMLATIVVMTCALLLCAFSGLYGVVYTDFVQFIIATGGAFLLAWLSVKEVGGLTAMYEQLSTNQDWMGRDLNLAPEITTELGAGGASGSMSIWNVIGYFGILWWGVALSGGYQAQRILACKDTRHASNAMLMHTIVYYAIVSLPWVVVALASVIVFPDMGEAGDDAAYPKMILHILPIGLRGIMIAAMIAAFISTMSTLFNWGSSYMVNDLYRRFIHPKASDKHYVMVSRILTVLVAVAGGVISFYADNIQELLGIFFVVGSGAAVVGVVRWLWWRVNAIGELAAFVMNYVVAYLLLFGHKLFDLEQPLFDPLMASLLSLPDGMSFTNEHDLLGARMLFMTIVGLFAVVVVSLLTKPTEISRLKEFVQRTRIFVPGWQRVTREIPGYQTAHPVGQVLLDWVLVMATVCSLLFALNNIVRCEPLVTAGLFALFVVLLVIVLKRTKRECPVDDLELKDTGDE
ncbi:MAG: sodium:solute symporter family protein [Akkermansiaceae bacterium]